MGLTVAIRNGQLVGIDVVEVLADPVVDEPGDQGFQHRDECVSGDWGPS